MQEQPVYTGWRSNITSAWWLGQCQGSGLYSPESVYSCQAREIRNLQRIMGSRHLIDSRIAITQPGHRASAVGQNLARDFKGIASSKPQSWATAIPTTVAASKYSRPSLSVLPRKRAMIHHSSTHNNIILGKRLTERCSIIECGVILQSKMAREFKAKMVARLSPQL